MLIIHMVFLILSGLIGILFNWLLILAIQRKSYHYQESHCIPTPTTNLSLLRQNRSLTGQTFRPPLLPALRSSISTIDKYILAFLINDIFVCNFIIPLRIIEVSQGLPCVFLCFILKVVEKFTTVIEIIINSLLLITSLMFFRKNRLVNTNLYFVCLLIMTPLMLMYLATTLTYVDINEYESDERPPSCKQIFIYINEATYKTFNMSCCLITYAIIFIQFILLIKMKWAVKKYKQNSLKNVSEVANLTKNMQQELLVFDQTDLDQIARRSIYTPSIHNASTTTSIATDMTPTIQRSFQVFDYLTYLTIIENSQTLIQSTYLLSFIYLSVHIPYWIYELTHVQWSYDFKDLYILCHILKPFCYMLTNEKYRFHMLAILQCKIFRMSPNILRRKSYVVTLNNNK